MSTFVPTMVCGLWQGENSVQGIQNAVADLWKSGASIQWAAPALRQPGNPCTPRAQVDESLGLRGVYTEADVCASRVSVCARICIHRDGRWVLTCLPHVEVVPRDRLLRMCTGFPHVCNQLGSQ